MKTMLRLLVVVLTAMAFATSTAGVATWAAENAGVEEKGDTNKNTNKNTNKPVKDQD